MTAVGCAVVEEVSRPQFLAQVQENGDYLADQLRAVSKQFGLGEARGRGLLLALDLLRPDGARIVEAALQKRLLLNSPRPSTLRFMPALNVSRVEIDRMLQILRECLSS